MSYHLVKKIAAGGMAEVYLAIQPGRTYPPKKWCVKKKIVSSDTDNQDFEVMFQDEFNTCARLNHPNVIYTKELTTIDDVPAIVMEYIPGVDIRDLLVGCERKQTRLPIPLALYITHKIALGLDYVHTLKDEKNVLCKIVHRDISPQNILISLAGEVKIIDFGVADRHSKLNVTSTGMVKGKFSYMSPEQVLIKPLDHRSDQYALAIICWEMLAMQKLFFGSSEVETIDMVRSATITKDLKKLNPKVDQRLYDIVHKALHKHAKQRYKSCSALAQDLEAYMQATFPNYPFATKLSQFIKDIVPNKEQKIKELLALADQSARQNNQVTRLAKLSGPKKIIRSQRAPSAAFRKVATKPPPPPSQRRRGAARAAEASSIVIRPSGGKTIDIGIADSDMHGDLPVLSGQPMSAASTPSFQLGGLGAGPLPSGHTQSTYQDTVPHRLRSFYSNYKQLIVLLGAALVILSLVPKWLNDFSPTVQPGPVHLKFVPKHVMIKVNNKLLKKHHVTSPITLTPQNLVEGPNVIELSREGFKPTTLEVTHPSTHQNNNNLIVLKKESTLSYIKLSIHPNSDTTSIRFRLADNIDSGTVTKGQPYTMAYLVSGKTYAIKFSGHHGSFVCQLTAASGGSTKKYAVFSEREHCEST